jgi:MFS family permease
MRLHFNRETKLFLLATLLYGFAFSVWELFFNLYILSLGFSSDILGLIRAATPLSALILGLPLGLLSDRIGRRTSMLIGLVIGFIGMLFEIRLLNPYLIFLFGLVQGAGFMLYRVSQPPFIMAISKKKNQALIFSLNFGLLTVASMIGNIIAGQAPGFLSRLFDITPGSAASYQWVITAGILFASSSLIPIFMISEPKIKPDRKFLRTPIKLVIKKLAANLLVRRLAIINVITGFGAALLIPYLNVFLRQKFDISDDLLGLLFSISSLLVFVGSLISPWLVKITRSRIIPTVATQSISVIFLFSLGFSPFLWLASISLMLRTVLMQMSTPLLENYAMLISEPESQGSIASVRAIGWQLGQTVGIFLSGIVQTRFGFPPLFIATGSLYTLAIFLTWFYFRGEEKKISHAGKA